MSMVCRSLKFPKRRTNAAALQNALPQTGGVAGTQRVCCRRTYLILLEGTVLESQKHAGMTCRGELRE
eukprot:5675199-Amphidinium_carterae.1